MPSWPSQRWWPGNVEAVSHAVVALTGIGEMAYLANSAKLWSDRQQTAADWPELADQVTEGMEVNGDSHAPAEYRRHLATVVTRRALETALERAR